MAVGGRSLYFFQMDLGVGATWVDALLKSKIKVGIWFYPIEVRAKLRVESMQMICGEGTFVLCWDRTTVFSQEKRIYQFVKFT